MNQWLKKRLTALFCTVSVCGGGTYLHAQSDPDLKRAAENARRVSCQSNIKQVMLGVLQYAQDYDEKLPRARAWTDILQPYVRSREIFNCPALPSGKTGGYAFNQNLSQFSQAKIENSAMTIAVYETSNLGKNVFGVGTGRAYRHFGGSNIGFIDGHIKWFRKGNEKQQVTFKP